MVGIAESANSPARSSAANAPNDFLMWEWVWGASSTESLDCRFGKEDPRPAFGVRSGSLHPDTK